MLTIDRRLSLWYTGIADAHGTITAPVGPKGAKMGESVYKVIELVGTSTDSWEKATKAAIEQASRTLHDLRIAEVVALDVQIEDGEVYLYRAKVKLSFKYHEDD